MKIMRLLPGRQGIAAGGIAALLLWAIPAELSAIPSFTKRERKDCSFCHLGKWDSGQFTEAGDYYKSKRTLKNFVPKPKAAPASPAAATPKEPSKPAAATPAPQDRKK